MSENVFVTGGSGFVGQHLIKVLLNNGYGVYGLARSPKSMAKIEKSGAIPVLDDLTRLSHNTQAALKKCEYVIHSAAYMDFNYEEEKFYSINVVGTRGLLTLAKEQGVKRFIYISAAPVVPGSPIVNVTEETAQDGLPKALYPKTKALAEREVLSANDDNFITISLRPPAIWGPNNHHFQEVLERVKQKKWAWIGGGRQILSTVHIQNLAAAVLAAMHHGNGGEAYFITDGDRRSMRESFTEIIKAYGLDPGHREIPLGIASFLAQMSEFIWRLLGLTSRPPIPPLAIRLMAREFSVSDEKARKELKYRNAITFEEGIRNLLQS